MKKHLNKLSVLARSFGAEIEEQKNFSKESQYLYEKEMEPLMIENSSMYSGVLSQERDGCRDVE